MKKKLLWIIIPLILIVSISVLLFIQIKYPKKTFSELLGTNESNITKVLMVNSFTGHRIETTNKEKIKELVNLLNNRTYRKDFKQTNRTGYLYAYDFYSEDKMLFRIVGGGDYVYIFNKERTIDAFYDVSKEISISSIEHWFNSIPSKK
ncbi:hypothetical protein CLHUN_19600 [Ruminiclostridium hungatei]|uniref:Uncharacterized protein n=1 Tax=Ruminiclostridium hungatei TaxID=48256 RepID=A0A1V4SLQ3_RUMHU|nr:hypothetical protein [Ruminiclostridium hungatei]OPX44161.1 hypothetical protein CLHUN_19600 [Ruminiclostridium hungatei]